MPRHIYSHYAFALPLFLLCLSQAQALTFDLGVSFSQPVLDYKDNNDNILAQNAAPTAIWPSVSLQSRERYFGESNWGYSISAMAWYFSMNKQKVKDEVVDFGTSVEGYYAYLTPTLYYRFGDKHIMESSDKWNWTLGIGLGIGLLVADGTTYTNYASTKTTENIHVSGEHTTVSSGFIIEAVKNRWFIRFSSYGPEIEISDTRKVRLNDNAIVIGKRFDLKEFFN